MNLGCELENVEYWPFTCLVVATEHEVTWQNFEQPHRPTRDYSSFGPFVFEFGQSEDALRTLLDDAAFSLISKSLRTCPLKQRCCADWKETPGHSLSPHLPRCTQ